MISAEEFKTIYDYKID